MTETRRPPRVVSDRLALGAFVLAVAVAVPVLFHAGRHQWFFLDEFDFLAGRDLFDPGDLLRPRNEHWTTVPIVAYRVLYRLVGLRSYTPYLALAITAHLATACLLRVVVRRAGVGPWLATAAVVPFVFFGRGNENIVWGFQVTMGASLAFGLAHVLAVDHDGPVGRRDLLGLVCGLLAVMSSGVGVVMVGAAAVTALLRRGWRVALLHGGPLAAAYLLWTALADPPSYPGSGQGDVVGLATAILGEAAGGFGGHPAATWVLVGSTAVGIGLLATQRPRLSAFRPLVAPAALALAAVGFCVATAYQRASLGSDPASRYVHVTAALLVPLTAVGVNAVVARWPRILPVAAALFLVGVPVGVERLDDRDALVLGNRQDTLVLAQVAHDEEVDRSTRPWPFWNPEVTAGWLADGIESGRIPRPDDVDPEQRRVASLQLALQVSDPGVVGDCSPSSTVASLDLDEGELVRFDGGPFTVVEVRGEERTRPVQIMPLASGDPGQIVLRAARPVVLEPAPGTTWAPVSLCRPPTS